MSRVLEPLVVRGEDPGALLAHLEGAIAGERSFLPVPGHDPGRAQLLIDSQRAGQSIDPEIAVVVGTSGSTGTPKGAQLTAANLVASADATHQALGGPGHWLLALPAHHIAGLQVLVRSLVAGVTPLSIDVSGGFEIASFAHAATRLAATADRVYTSLTPMQLIKALDTLQGIEALRQFTAILIGGAPLNPQVAEAAARMQINLVTTYGSAESSGGCVYDGRPLPGCRIKLIDERIHLAGPTIAAGYRNHPAHPDFGERGWFRTSDTGRIIGGLLEVTGRLDNVIDSGGLKLHPEVLERELLAIAGVKEACVVGVPDPRLGQTIAVAYTGSLAPTDIIAALDHLPRWQLPRLIQRVDSLPLTSLSKPDRPAVQALFDT